MSEPDAERVQRYAVAFAELRQDGLSTPDRFDRAAARAAVVLADEEISDARHEQAKTRASGHERQLLRQHDELKALRAEVERLRISPDHLEEMLDIDPNDPLQKVASYAVEFRKRAETAEAKLGHVREAILTIARALPEGDDIRGSLFAAVYIAPDQTPTAADIVRAQQIAAELGVTE